MNREGNTDVRLTPLDEPPLTVTLTHVEPRIIWSQRKLPFWPDRTRLDWKGHKYLWKGDKRLYREVHGSSTDSNLIATFKHHKDKYDMQCGILRVHKLEGQIPVEVVILTSLVIQSRAENVGK